MRFEIACVGSMTMDIFLDIDRQAAQHLLNTDQNGKKFFRFELGEKYLFDSSGVSFGGGAVNSAVGFQRLGSKVAAVGMVGDDELSTFILSYLKHQQVNIEFVQQVPRQTTSFATILNSAEDRTVVRNQVSSPNLVSNAVFDMIKQETQGLYIAHLNKSNNHFFHRLAECIGPQEKMVAWNPGKTQLKKPTSFFKDFIPLVDMLILNREEAELFSGVYTKKLTQPEFDGAIGIVANTNSLTENREAYDLREVGARLLDLGIRQVIITDGIRGTQYFNQHNQHYYIPAHRVPVVSTLGAGDAFAVGAVMAFVRGHSPFTSLRWGKANAESVVGYFSAQEGLLNQEQIKQQSGGYHGDQH